MTLPPSPGITTNPNNMKVQQTIYMMGAVICAVLTVIFRVASMPVALVYDALDAMAKTADEVTNNLNEKSESTPDR